MPNIEISDLPLATLPLDSVNSFFEVQTIEGGESVSRKIAETDIMADLPDGTTVGSIIRLSVVPDTYVNSEQVLADGVSVELQHVTTPVVRTLTTAAGGLQVDNQLTGGGFERVLTIADIFSGGLDDLSDVTLTAPSTGSVLYKSAGNWLDTNAIQIDPAARVQLLDNGNLRFRTDINEGIAVFATTDLRPKVVFRNIADDTDLGIVGFPNSTGITLRNNQIGGQISLTFTDVGPSTHNAFQATPGADARLYFDNASVARTAAAASGGLEANNTLTGGGFERVLTTADAFGGALNDLSDVVITSADSFDTLFFNGSNWVDNAMLQVTGTGATMGGVTLGITGLSIRGRFNSVGESGGSTQTRALFTDDDGGTAYGEVEWATTGGGSDGDAMYFRNRRHGGHIEFEGENDIGTLVPLSDFDPQTVIQTLHTDLVLDGATTRLIEIFPTGGSRFQIDQVVGVPDVTTLGQIGQNAMLTMTSTEIVTLGNILSGSGRTIIGGGLDDRVDFTADSSNILRMQHIAGDWAFHSMTNGDTVRAQADQGGGSTVDLWIGDPDADMKLFQSGTEVARTITAATGGFQANNTLTGAGFERVLTTADLAAPTGVTSGPGTYVKTADQSRTNNTPLADSDLDTGTTLDGTSYYEFTCVLLFDSASATPDIRVGVSGSASTGTGMISVSNDEHATAFGEATLGDATDSQGTVSSYELDGVGPRMVIVHGFVYWTAGGAASQSFNVVWSQDTTNGTATTLLRGSWMRIQRIGAT